MQDKKIKQSQGWVSELGSPGVRVSGLKPEDLGYLGFLAKKLSRNV